MAKYASNVGEWALVSGTKEQYFLIIKIIRSGGRNNSIHLCNILWFSKIIFSYILLFFSLKQSCEDHM